MATFGSTGRLGHWQLVFRTSAAGFGNRRAREVMLDALRLACPGAHPRALLPYVLGAALQVLGCSSAQSGAAVAPPQGAPVPTDEEATSVVEAPATPPATAPAETGAATRAEPPAQSRSPEEIVAAPDRTASDRAIDERREPKRLLAFLGVRDGDRVADLGTGSGYTAELLARAVGRTGRVYAHSDRKAPEEVQESLEERLRREAGSHITLMQLDYEAPFSPEAINLDLVTFLLAYHDTVAQGVNRQKLHAAVYGALRPGGLYVIADHAAEPLAGPEVAARLHRVSERLVEREVTAAGFRLVDRADFMRNPSDDPRQPSSAGGFKTNRFILKFRKPE